MARLILKENKREPIKEEKSEVKVETFNFLKEKEKLENANTDRSNDGDGKE